MLKTDAKLLQSIANLQGQPDFEKFFDWIKNSYQHLAVLFVTDTSISDHQHRIQQGRALNCYHIKTVIETAKAELQKIKDKTQG